MGKCDSLPQCRTANIRVFGADTTLLATSRSQDQPIVGPNFINDPVLVNAIRVCFSQWRWRYLPCALSGTGAVFDGAVNDAVVWLKAFSNHEITLCVYHEPAHGSEVLFRLRGCGLLTFS